MLGHTNYISDTLYYVQKKKFWHHHLIEAALLSAAWLIEQVAVKNRDYEINTSQSSCFEILDL